MRRVVRPSGPTCPSTPAGIAFGALVSKEARMGTPHAWSSEAATSGNTVLLTWLPGVGLTELFAGGERKKRLVELIGIEPTTS